MLDPLFKEAWCHAPGGHTVLGRKLHALSALDLLTLEAIESPFLTEGALLTQNDLLLAVWILSNSYSPDLTIENLELNAEGQSWLMGISDKIDLVANAKQIQIYMKDYFSLPEMMRTMSNRPSSPLGCPWMLSTVVMVCRELNIPLLEAWTMGIGQLVWYRCSLEEQASVDSRVVSPEMRDRMEHAKNSSKVMQMSPGESIEAFSERTGIPIQDAAFFLHQQSSSITPDAR